MNLSISPAFLFFFSPQPSSQTWVRDLPFALPLPTPSQRITIILFLVHSSFESLAICSSPLFLFARSPGRSTWLLESMCLRASFFIITPRGSRFHTSLACLLFSSAVYAFLSAHCFQSSRPGRIFFAPFRASSSYLSTSHYIYLFLSLLLLFMW